MIFHNIEHHIYPGKRAIFPYSIQDKDLAFYSRKVVHKYVQKVNIQTALDCGASIGTYTALLSQFAKHVHSFEPTSTFEFLTKNMEALLNEKVIKNNISLYKIAISNVTGTISERLKYLPYDRGPAKYWIQDEFPFTTIDDFVSINSLGNIDFIKIDVDGFDYEALVGATSVIEKFHPALYLEMSDRALNVRGFGTDDMLEFLKLHNYKLLDQAGEYDQLWI